VVGDDAAKLGLHLRVFLVGWWPCGPMHLVSFLPLG
jgi:hypothetical protein